MNRTIFIAGGGTGGHLFPAVAIGEELVKNNFSIIFIGSKFGIEKDYFINSKFKYYLLNIRGIQRSFSLKSIFRNFLLPIRFIISYCSSIVLLYKYRPCAIIGTGGYASGLPLIAGILFKIPIFIQEQNSIPGIITKKLHKYSKKIFLAYPQAKNILNNNKCIITGNPIRGNLKLINKSESKEELQFDKNKKLILIIGGSQGASAINQHIIKNIQFYIQNNYQLLWQCGINDFNEIRQNINNKLIRIIKFIDNMSLAYSSADIVISRSGAIAISELVFFQKAMILIPFPNAAKNHQDFNTNYLIKQKACKKIIQKDLPSGILEKTIKELFKDNKKIIKLENNAKKISTPYATKKITNEIINCIS